MYMTMRPSPVRSWSACPACTQGSPAVMVMSQGDGMMVMPAKPTTPGATAVTPVQYR